MNHIKHLLTLVAALAAVLFSFPKEAVAQQYGVLATIWEAPAWTNNPATVTNLSLTTGHTNGLSLTKYADFGLDVILGLTNAAAGTLDIAWETSNDGVCWGTSTAGAGHKGWFSVPLTNSGTTVFWNSNITVNAIGYWRAKFMTNNSGQHITNVLIRAYVKPKRFN